MLVDDPKVAACKRLDSLGWIDDDGDDDDDEFRKLQGTVFYC